MYGSHGVTASLICVEWTRAPFLAVTVSVAVPCVVARDVVTVSFEPPGAFTGLGEKLAFAPPGRPVTDNAMLPANPAC
jgi:hypothetical protein